jgi:hypothetical protein
MTTLTLLKTGIYKVMQHEKEKTWISLHPGTRFRGGSSLSHDLFVSLRAMILISSVVD